VGTAPVGCSRWSLRDQFADLETALCEGRYLTTRSSGPACTGGLLAGVFAPVTQRERSIDRMRQRRARIVFLCIAIALHGCSYTWVDGPSRPLIRSVSSVSVTDLESSKTKEITDPVQIESALASWAFSPEWMSEDTFRIPVYRVDLHAGGETSTYWLGTNSNPPRFPCYSLCSGWWIAPSTASGDIHPSLYKGLTSAVYLYLFDALDIADIGTGSN
jgi:hypothetical protein